MLVSDLQESSLQDYINYASVFSYEILEGLRHITRPLSEYYCMWGWVNTGFGI